MDGGKTLNTNFADYKMPMATDMPPSQVAHVDTYEPEGPLGAKECGEGLASPTAPAISDAVYHATGYRCKDLPITPEKILKHLESEEQSRSACKKSRPRKCNSKEVTCRRERHLIEAGTMSDSHLIAIWQMSRPHRHAGCPLCRGFPTISKNKFQ